MPDFSTQAVVLRSVDYGDSDKIVTLFTSGYGKISAIAKGAKRSMKRFGGTLELFSLRNRRLLKSLLKQYTQNPSRSLVPSSFDAPENLIRRALSEGAFDIHNSSLQVPLDKRISRLL